MKMVLILIYLMLLNTACFNQPNVKILTHKVDLDTCKQWKINLDSLATIIANMTPLPGEIHHCCYHNYHCYINGTLTYKGETYNYYLNAGGWIDMYSFDYKDQFSLACTDKRYFKYFISTYDGKGVSGG